MGKSVLIDRPSVTNQQLNSIVPLEEDVDLTVRVLLDAGQKR